MDFLDKDHRIAASANLSLGIKVNHMKKVPFFVLGPLQFIGQSCCSPSSYGQKLEVNADAHRGLFFSGAMGPLPVL